MAVDPVGEGSDLNHPDAHEANLPARTPGDDPAMGGGVKPVHQAWSVERFGDRLDHFGEHYLAEHVQGGVGLAERCVIRRADPPPAQEMLERVRRTASRNRPTRGAMSPAAKQQHGCG